MNKKTIIAYTDGACKGNPGPGGWGWVEYPKGLDSNFKFIDFGGEKKSTNNRMELKAVIEYLKNAPTGRNYIIYSDSLYVLKCLVRNGSDTLKIPGVYSGWIKEWIKKGLDKRLNGEMWVELTEIIEEHLKKGSTLTFDYVKAHSDIVGNNLADYLANLGVSR